MLALLAALALSAPINPDPAAASIKTFTDCASGGSAAQTIAGGAHLLTVTGEDTYVCVTDSASTCASGGFIVPTGAAIHVTFGNAAHSVSCRSAGSTGDLQFTKAP